MRKTVTLTLNRRDGEGTVLFEIKEMGALQLEKWLTRGLLLLAGAGALDQEALQDSKAIENALLTSGGRNMFSALKYEEMEPLLDEMLACCSKVADGIRIACTKADGLASIADEIGVSNLIRLRVEAMRLNLSFLREEGGNPFAFLSEEDTTG